MPTIKTVITHVMIYGRRVMRTMQYDWLSLYNVLKPVVGYDEIRDDVVHIRLQM